MNEARSGGSVAGFSCVDFSGGVNVAAALVAAAVAPASVLVVIVAAIAAT
jgi:hypothetical protein